MLLATLPIEERPLPYVGPLSQIWAKISLCILVGARTMSTKHLIGNDR